MHILKGNPTISCRGAGSDYVIDAALHFTATLICPCCHNNNEVKTKGHLMGGVFPMQLSMNIGWETSELLSRRDCEHCGTTSAATKLDRDKLLEDAKTRVTLTWVKEEIIKLKQASQTKVVVEA